MKQSLIPRNRRFVQYEIVLTLLCLSSVGQAEIVRRCPARVRTVEEVAVVSRLSADILEIGFAEGDAVEKGQLLYRLDETRFAAAVSNQAARVEEARAKLSLAETTFSRKKALLERKAIAQAEYDSVMCNREALSAELRAELAALALAEDDLRHTRILAPISGRIGLTAKTVGNYVTPETGTLAEIVATDPVRIRFSLSMTDFARFFGCDADRLRQGASLRISDGSGPVDVPPGTIEFVDTRAVEKTDTVLVYVRQPNPCGRLVPNAAVTLELTIPEGEDSR